MKEFGVLLTLEWRRDYNTDWHPTMEVARDLDTFLLELLSLNTVNHSKFPGFSEEDPRQFIYKEEWRIISAVPITSKDTYEKVKAYCDNQ